MTIAQLLESLYDNFVLSINFINNEITGKADKVSSATADAYAAYMQVRVDAKNWANEQPHREDDQLQ